MDIIIKDLCKKYESLTVLNNYNQVFKQGEITFLMGPSGVGKTTLIKILMGIESFDSGNIIGLKNKKISVVFQDDSLCENLSVLSNIKLVCENLSDAEIIKKLELLDLHDCCYKRIRELSGGMKRRVSILRAILYGFDLLIMDEPFKGLDLETKNKVIDFISLNIKGKSAIIVTHDKIDIEKFNNSKTIFMKT